MICKKQEIITKKYTYMDLQKNIKKQSSCICLHYTRKKHFRSTMWCARYVMILDGLTIIIKWNVSMEL